ncbi:ABC transporter ATP-binding protein [Elstera cyanobacteriorum]|uniref:ABC transporter ATP-binding protein n=1 Tax=Elstera cyanobacteriorum TaxID=2022747 RepID=UPI0019B9A0B2|nr:ABC transporter ATP-binding protein [Elstera cyanobacteriorum]MCK6442949.1 ABC transporter ATP-binding protein [Elstera cyanobacteriorum]GFZ88745.1 ABC transporter ATP-binding protein [Elstera cyanobacteriorum]
MREAGSLIVDTLSVAYGDALALDGVSLSVQSGEVTTLIGTNGAGKTTLIRAIAGLLPVRSGQVSFDGRDITGRPSHRICDLGIGQVAEGRQVFPTLSVRENLLMGAVIPRARALADETYAAMLDLFPRLQERLHQAAGTLSGGEQQMLAIARCLMGQPRLIMFDEPSLGLSPAMVGEVFRIIRRLKDQGMTIILVEQNVAASLALADQAYVLETGRITLSGTGQTLLRDPRVREAYLGL